MRFKSRKMTMASVLLLAMIVQVVFAGRQNPVSDVVVAEAETDSVLVSDNTLPETEADLITEEEVVSADLNVVYRSNLTSTEDVDEFESNIDKGDFNNKIISYTVSRLCVYAEPDLASDVVGVMYSGSEADILEKGEEWTKISSGDVTGYVRNVEVLFGNEAQIVARAIGTETAVVSADELTVYTDASTSSEILMTLSKGEEVVTMDEYGSFVMINSSSGYGYVEKSGISVSYGLSEAITIEEEQKRQAEEEAARAKKAADEAAAAAQQAAKEKYSNVATTNRSVYNATEEEIHLLAAIVYYESSWEPAEGQLAVANVVLNRVLSSKFRQNTIADVVYAPGQFSGVVVNGEVSQKFQNILNMSNEQLNVRGSYDAAVSALSGVNNIGDLTFFISLKKANYAKYTNYTIINNHCFYNY